MSSEWYQLSRRIQQKAIKLPGPIVVFGAGGFVGVNVLNSLLLYRKDVYGVSQNPTTNWRFKKSKVPRAKLVQCDIVSKKQLEDLFKKIKPQTIFNLAAYGAYAEQQNPKKIYETNFLSTLQMMECAKKYGIRAYIQAGSSSEYGFNAAGPKENSHLDVNSHYAVSKSAAGQLLSYYQKVENVPAVHLRLYSVYGPWEEPHRLIPSLIHKARHGSLPPFVDPQVSRDFLYVTDATAAFITAAAYSTTQIHNNCFNVGTGIQTTISELAHLTKKLFNVSEDPIFSTLPNKRWDVKRWYANPSLAEKVLKWKAKNSLKEGLIQTKYWQENSAYDRLLKEIS